MFTVEESENILFLDTETVRMTASFDELSPRMQALWEKKSKRYSRNDTEKSVPELYEEYAGIHAEFGKLVCVSCGFLIFHNNVPSIRMTSAWGDDEVKVLKEFTKILDDFTRYRKDKRQTAKLCAHNGKEFDFPWLGRRMLIQGLPLPSILRTQGKKPWEVPYIDTMDLWKFGDYKAFTSLDLLSAIFDIPTPKDDIDGSMVGKVYWEEKDVDRIKDYCEKDVLTTAQVLLKMSQLPLIPQT